jgi:FMN hydrolase / 5-amino-6-(5-phospho-D-ribitylamino)uracil phosphatase
MMLGGVRAICFDLDNTLWEIEPVLTRAERILADWLRGRYPRITDRYSNEAMMRAREALALQQPHRAHDFTYLRRETLARLAADAGYDAPTASSIAHQAFATWHAARNQCSPYDDVVPALELLRTRFRLATLSNGNADLVCIGLAHHFEIRLHAGDLGYAKPDPRAYSALADALTLEPAEILFVGDEPHADVIGPKSAGMRAVWVNRAGAEWPVGLIEADASVADLAELASLLA